VRNWKPGDRVTVHCNHVDDQDQSAHDDSMMAANQRIWGYETPDGSFAQFCRVLPERFAGICGLPQPAGEPISTSLPELERCINELGMVGCLLDPDPGEGDNQTPSLCDEYWYPLYEKLVALRMPAMIHVSSCCNPNFHHTGAHYINADTTAFMQLIQGDLFKDFPELKFVIPHGGGAVPFHWGRYRGLCLSIRKKPCLKPQQQTQHQAESVGATASAMEIGCHFHYHHHCHPPKNPNELAGPSIHF
jgi:hypothetical protein